MPKVLLLHTGGTLGMAGGRPSALRPAAFFRTLKQRVPELFRLADIELELFSNLDSSEMQPELWSRMAAHLHQRLPHFDGAVVTHGTDTLAYTASALSFMLRGLPRPVVLTGSQRPLTDVRTDARTNLVDACLLATSRIPEVGIAFGSKLMQPTVATVGAFALLARSRRKVTTRAAAWPASRRIDIGVVPAWLASPSMVTRCQEMP